MEALRREDDRVVSASRLLVSGLAEAVHTPHPDTLLLVNSEGVIVSTSDEADSLSEQTQKVWRKTFVFPPLHNTVAKLILLAGAPDPNVTLLVQGNGVIRTATNLGYFRQFRH